MFGAASVNAPVPTPSLIKPVLSLLLTDPVTVSVPPVTLVGFKVSEETVGRGGGITVSEADRLTPP